MPSNGPSPDSLPLITLSTIVILPRVAPLEYSVTCFIRKFVASIVPEVDPSV